MTELTFKEKEHEYWYGDRQLTSVTSWLAQFSAPFDLKEVSKRYAKYLRTNGFEHVEGKKITAKEVQKHWDFIREDGTRVHRQLEAFIKGEKLFPKPNGKAKLAIEWLHNFQKGLDKPFVEPELKVHSLLFGLAGMVDLFVQEGDRTTFKIVDWKVVDNMTADKLKKYTLQLSTYAHIIETETHLTLDNLTLVQITDEGVIEHKIEYKKDEIIELLEKTKNEKRND